MMRGFRCWLPAAAACVLLLAALQPLPGQTPWRPAKAPLMTRWARDVSPARAHPEYPRPQMARHEWTNLNGLWEYAITTKDAPPPATWQGRILVPFPAESALSGVMKSVQPDQALWYRRTFTVPSAWAGKRVLVHFGAVDWSAEVTLNGRALGTHAGGYDGFTFDATPALKPKGPQVLTVRVTDPTDAGGQPHGKQVLRPGGIMYTATTGIWQTVWLEPVPAAHIEAIQVLPDVDRHAATVTVSAAGLRGPLSVQATAADGARVVAKASGAVGRPIRLAIPSAKLWSPERPFLYRLTVSLSGRARVVDSVDSYFGMRKIALGKDKAGVTRLFLNNKPYFQVGPLDQGFWPDGLYTAPTDEALRYDIKMTKRLGFNMARKHVKVEPDRWYYWCDRLGLLVWQDMPSGSNRTPEERAQFERELAALLRGRGNHPCIVQWVVFNEGWGQYDTERVTGWVKRADPSRLADNASGWTDRKVGDVIDMHNYPGPGSPKPEAARAAVLGEFGGLGLKIDGHTWEQRTWGYQTMADQQALTRRYVDLLRRAYRLRQDPGLSAVVYTQTTDVETECNGLMTYDRAVCKVEPTAASAANRGAFPPAPKVVSLSGTADKGTAEWRYTLAAPAEGWQTPDFDDSGWQQGRAGFGTASTPGAIVGTTWSTGDIWLRRSFTLSSLPKSPGLWMHHDEDAEAYINGVRAVRGPGFTTAYDLYDIPAAAAKAVRIGRNVIAVHCRQTTGGQYIDAGLVDLR